MCVSKHLCAANRHNCRIHSCKCAWRWPVCTQAYTGKNLRKQAEHVRSDVHKGKVLVYSIPYIGFGLHTYWEEAVGSVAEHVFLERVQRGIAIVDHVHSTHPGVQRRLQVPCEPVLECGPLPPPCMQHTIQSAYCSHCSHHTIHRAILASLHATHNSLGRLQPLCTPLPIPRPHHILRHAGPCHIAGLWVSDES